MEFRIKYLKEDNKLSDKHWEIVKTIYPNIMLNSKVANKYWNKLEKIYPEYQIFLLDLNDQIIGFSNTIPFNWNKPLKKLPETGWDWLIEKGITDYEKGIVPNNLGGLQVGISKKYQNKGFSKIIIKEAIKLCKEKGYDNFIIPIRPTLKYKYPLISMKKYIRWQKDNEIFDPWIRTHIKCGAQIIKICNKSMTYSGSINEWEKWSEISLIKSGKYIIDGALQPIKINIKKNIGLYYDQNIWINYKL